MLVDKLAIGLVVVAVFYIGQRFLEAYKGRQALWTEISKERVSHIADEWNEMNKWDCMVGETLYEIVQIMVARDPKLASNLSSHGIRPSLKETSAVASLASAGEIKKLLDNPPENLARAIAASIAQGKVVENAIQGNRFWLGQDLYEHCRRFQMTLNTICTSISASDLATLKTAIPELEERREDVLSVLKLMK